MSYKTDGIMIHTGCMPRWLKSLLDRDIGTMRKGNLKDQMQRCAGCKNFVGQKGFYYIYRTGEPALGFDINYVNLRVIGQVVPKLVSMHDASQEG